LLHTIWQLFAIQKLGAAEFASFILICVAVMTNACGACLKIESLAFCPMPERKSNGMGVLSVAADCE
jgi:hypothetical protein